MNTIESHLLENVKEYLGFARKRLAIRNLPPTRFKRVYSRR